MLHYAAARRQARRDRRDHLLDMATAALGGKPVNDLLKRLAD